MQRSDAGSERRRPRAWTRRAGVALLAATVAVAACADRARTPVIGAAMGQRSLFAARLAIADANDSDETPVDTTFLLEDTNRAEPAILAARRLASTPGMVAVLGHSNSAASLAASQIYNDAGVVQLSPSSSAAAYSGAGPYSYRLVPSDRRQARFLARYVARNWPDARVAVLWVNDEYGRGLAADAVATLDSLGIQPVLELPHMERDTTRGELDESLRAVAIDRPDVVLWLGRASPLISALPRLRAIIGDAPVIGADALSTTTQYPTPPGGYGDVRYVDFVDLDATPEVREFARRYDERFGLRPTGTDALTYDATRLLIAGIRAGARTGAEMRDFLDSLGRTRPPYQGVTGAIAFDSVGDVDRGYVVLRATGL